MKKPNITTLILLTFLSGCSTIGHTESTTDAQWQRYYNEMGKILKERRKIDPEHNPADRPLKDPWDEIWETPKKDNK